MKQWLIILMAGCPLVAAVAILLMPTNSPSPQLPGAVSQAGSVPAPATPSTPPTATGSGTSAAAVPNASHPATPPVSYGGGSNIHSNPSVAASQPQVSQGNSVNTGAAGVMSLPLIPPNVPLDVFPKAALDLAIVTGRRIIPASEAQSKRPYNSVGRFFNQNASGFTVGSGVLIHSDVVLTAAHVIENVMQREATFGPPYFEIPGMKPVLVGDAELDAGWKSKNVTADIGVCKLDDLLYPDIPIQRTEFETEEEPLFGTSVVSLGYDLDIWVACGCPRYPPLVERSGAFRPFPHADGNKMERLRNFMEDYQTAAAPLMSVLHKIGQNTNQQRYISLENKRLAQLDDDTDTAATIIGGIALLAGTYAYLHENTNSQYGWKSEMIGSLGCDGGPVLSKHRVIGVMGYPDGDTIGPLKIRVGYLLGTRLTHIVADMVEDFH